MNFGCIVGADNQITDCSIWLLNSNLYVLVAYLVLSLVILIIVEEIFGRKGSYRGFEALEFAIANLFSYAGILIGLIFIQQILIYITFAWIIGTLCAVVGIWLIVLYKISAYKRFCRRQKK